ncbi:bcl-2-like protein 15 isoform X1 [Podarcis raffonei]|uniref:bcl-2-like protein 15 isoform X1 n=1 Tax=Podarcis raffonei TaxID=65483 RepID=UPI00232958AA|nr:bcl-2-like protein 15 isoform X1 [Podarcis raffonei]
MKDSMTFEEQVEQIAEALLADFPGQKSKTEFRVLHYNGASVLFEGGGSAASPFDPVPIANTLRRLGDQFNADLERPAREVIEAEGRKFKENVETLSKTWTIQNPELAYEKAFLVVAVKFFRYIAKKAPGVAQPRLLTEAINAAPEVRHYIERQGGWENLENRRGQNNP